MARVTVKVDASPLLQELRASFDRITDVVKQKLGVSLREFESKFVRERLTGGSGDTLKRRSGNLARSLHVETKKVSPNEVTGTIFFQGTGATYAPLHEFGGTIRGKNTPSGLLTIPQSAALTPAGVPKGKARDFKDTFFKKVGGTLLLFQRRGKDKAVVLFVLRESVTIPPRLKFRETFDAFQPQILKRIDEGITEVFGI